MKVRTRIILGLLVLSLAVSGALLWQFLAIQRLGWLSSDLRGKVTAVDTRGLVQEMRRLYQAAVFISTQKDGWDRSAEAEEYRARKEGLDLQFGFLKSSHSSLGLTLKSAWKLVESVRGTPEEQLCGLEKAYRDLSSAWEPFCRVAYEIERSYPSRTPSPGLPAAARILSLRERDAVVGRIEDLNDGINCFVEKALEGSVHQAEGDSALSGVLIIIAFGASFWAGAWIVRSVSGPLAALTRAHRQWMQEDFSHRVDLKGRGQDEFTELAGTGNAMAERLGQLDELKRDFLSHVSHELKSPLNSIRSSARMLLRESSGPLTQRQRRRVQLMIDNARRLSGNIINLLDYSKLEAGVFTYQFAEQDLVPLMHRFLEGLEPVAAEQGLRLEKRIPVGPTVMVRCDAERLLQVVGNLVDNALKFSSSGSALGVGLEVREEAADTGRGRTAEPGPFVLISVIDCGPGVPEEQRESIFSKFHQVKGSRKGVGLGLAICRKIVEAHQGWIWCEANPQGGAIFRVQLPLAGSKVAVS